MIVIQKKNQELKVSLLRCVTLDSHQIRYQYLPHRRGNWGQCSIDIYCRLKVLRRVTDQAQKKPVMSVGVPVKAVHV
jgi:hypothetical protein